jgi:hypothetical protein
VGPVVQLLAVSCQLESKNKLTLALFMLRVLADHANDAATVNHFALVADLLD